MDIFQHLTAIVRHSWVRAGCPKRVLIAFSGGADSCALLHVLHRLFLQNNGVPALFAVHVDHGLRSDSVSDADFARHTCEALEIPVYIKRVAPASPSENDARRARYDALYHVASQVQADAIALGHHMQDQTETVLLHLMRGTVQGMGGMQECSRQNAEVPMLWRPFLQVSQSLLRDAVIQAGLSFREDSSNSDDRYLRNHLRMNVLPLMRSRAPSLDAHVTQTASVLREEHDYLNALSDGFLDAHAVSSLPCPFISATAFQSLHPALRRRVVLRLLGRVLPAMPAPDFDQLSACASIYPGETVNLPAGCVLRHDGKFLHLLIPNPAFLPLASLEVLPFQPGISNGKTHQSVPKALYQNTCMRYRQPGDFIQPFGMPGTKSLQDYLTDRKIPAPFRDHLPLLCTDHEVLWVIGVGASEKMRTLPDEHENLLLHYPAHLPFFPYDHHTKEI